MIWKKAADAKKEKKIRSILDFHNFKHRNIFKWWCTFFFFFPINGNSTLSSVVFPFRCFFFTTQLSHCCFFFLLLSRFALCFKIYRNFKPIAGANTHTQKSFLDAIYIRTKWEYDYEMCYGLFLPKFSAVHL